MVVLTITTRGEGRTTEVSSGCLVDGDKSVAKFSSLPVPPGGGGVAGGRGGAQLQSGGEGVSDCPDLEALVRSEGSTELSPTLPAMPAAGWEHLAGAPLVCCALRYVCFQSCETKGNDILSSLSFLKVDFYVKGAKKML